MKKPVDIVTRGIVSDNEVQYARNHLEETEDYVWLSRTIRCRKYTIRGVPARLVDVVIAENLEQYPHDPMTVELSHKVGRYDGAIRDRICIRRRQMHQVKDWARVDFTITLDASAIDMISRLRIGNELRNYPTLRSEMNDYSIARIIMWHWRRYYLHLVDGDAIRQLADQWAAEVAAMPERPNWTLAEANRAASRRLYKYSRDEGWKKLTLRERERHGLRAQWVREEIYADAVNKRIGNALGVGEYTLYVAHPTG
jgi:hypothetical protein